MIPKTIADAPQADPFILLPLPDTLPSEDVLRAQAGALVASLSAHLANNSDLPPGALAASMRSTNRSAQILLNSARAAAAQERHALDAADVKLREVEYELAKVREEMARCMEYEPMYESMDMPDEETFLASASPEVITALPTDEESRKYALIIARLEAELAAVLEHEEKLSALTSERDGLVRARREVKAKFDAVDVWLADFTKTTNAMASKIKDVAKIPSAPGKIAAASSAPASTAGNDETSAEVPAGPPAA